LFDGISKEVLFSPLAKKRDKEQRLEEGQSPSLRNSSPSPCQREGDKGDRITI